MNALPFRGIGNGDPWMCGSSLLTLMMTIILLVVKCEAGLIQIHMQPDPHMELKHRTSWTSAVSTLVIAADCTVLWSATVSIV